MLLFPLLFLGNVLVDAYFASPDSFLSPRLISTDGRNTVAKVDYRMFFAHEPVSTEKIVGCDCDVHAQLSDQFGGHSKLDDKTLTECFSVLTQTGRLQKGGPAFCTGGSCVDSKVYGVYSL